MSEILSFTLYTALSLVGVTLISNYLYEFKEKETWIKSLASIVYNYSYLFLVIIGALFMYFDDVFNKNHIYLNQETSNFLFGISKSLFSIGAFSGAIKFASSLKLFKKEYKSIVMSPEFSDLLKDKLDAFAHSPDYLNRLDSNQLKKLWREVTLSKYKVSFPSIYEELKPRIDNDLFLKANTSFYYKHFYVEYDVELDKKDINILNVIYTTKYTIVRKTTDLFEWDFAISFHKDDYKKSNFSTAITIDGYEVFDSKKAQYQKVENIDDEIKDDFIQFKCKEKLKGKKMYHVKKVTKYKQDLTLDKFLGFGSGRIIDDLIVKIKYCENLDVYFKTVNKNIFEGNKNTEERELNYENRGLLLPGEKFILFLLRPGK